MNQPESIVFVTLKDLEEFILSTFSKKFALKKESTGLSRNPILNAVIQFIDNSYRNRGIARYASKNRFLTSYMKIGESQAKYSNRPAALDVWVGLVGTITDSESAGDEKFYVPATGGRYLLNSSVSTD